MAKKCVVGSQVQIKHKGVWYLAVVEKVKGSKCYVHYDRFDNTLDGWVNSRSVRTSKNAYSLGETVFVNWKGDWWPAEIHKLRRSKIKVHYKGHPNLWDEWVRPDQIRKFTDDVIFPEVKTQPSSKAFQLFGTG
jgi:hypothetical protein